MPCSISATSGTAAPTASNGGDPFSLKSEHQRSGKKEAGILRKVNVAIESCVAGLQNSGRRVQTFSCSGATSILEKTPPEAEGSGRSGYLANDSVLREFAKGRPHQSLVKRTSAAYWQSPRRGYFTQADAGTGSRDTMRCRASTTRRERGLASWRPISVCFLHFPADVPVNAGVDDNRFDQYAGQMGIPTNSARTSKPDLQAQRQALHQHWHGDDQCLVSQCH
jgi:hypothetical protein